MSASAGPNLYKKILFALLGLTVLTVAVSQVDLGLVGNLVVGLLIATVKATLVVTFFMHMKYEQRWWTGFVLFPLVLVIIMIFANLPDTGMNGYEKDSEWGFTTPAVKQIPHADGSTAPAPTTAASRS